MKNRCPITYKKVNMEGCYHPDALKKFGRKISGISPLSYTAQEQRIEAVSRVGKMSIQGVQPKLSAVFDKKKQSFEIVDMGGEFILKPQHHVYEHICENEDVSMKMAAVCKIEVPFHGMIFSKDGSLTYFIQRFDRKGKKGKVPVEDFAQLSGKSRDTKYESSIEQLIEIIVKYTTFPALEKLKLFERLIFSFLCGNEDMHLKNYSLIYRDNKWELSPAYDLLNTTILINEVQEESALPLSGRKRKWTSKLVFDYLGRERLGLTQKSIDNTISKFFSVIPLWFELLDSSFLTEHIIFRYREIISLRYNTLFGSREL